ncbi:unnamed protein product [Paramecium octaurelia]|uniref:Uncharacterized protein n=1 Tax=Paramecium octaurelia TaxID=43137 RepID=A0A8S1YDF4_PAROT|nr:unnamed protein product [Paramecium octaurelia]
MGIIIVLIQFIVTALSQTNDSIDCNKYFYKFGTTKSPLEFSGDVVYIQESRDIQINVKYTDVLFEDPIYFGLIQEDGKTPETTCLNLQVYHLPNTQDQLPQLLTNLSIFVSNNTNFQWRYYSFKIPISKLNKHDISTQNTSIQTYDGSYSINFESTLKRSFKYQFIFNFTINVNNNSQLLNDTKFSSQIIFDQSPIIVPGSKLLWCSNFTCQSYLNEPPLLYLNTIFFLQQVIVDCEFKNEKLENIEVYYTIDQIQTKAKTMRYNNTTPGQVIIILKVPFAWKKVSIKVISTLSRKPPSYTFENNVEITFRAFSSTSSTSSTTSTNSFPQPYDPIKIETQLRLCSDLTCQKLLETTPNLHFNDFVNIQQVIKSPTYLGFGLTNTQVWFIGEGLNVEVTPIQIINSTEGQVNMLLKVNIVWKAVSIKVKSQISTTGSGPDFYTYPLSTNSSQLPEPAENDFSLGCIRPQGTEMCASCEEECNINGFSSTSCGECHRHICYGFLIFLNMILLFATTI